MDKHIKIGCEVFVINNNQILLGKRKNAYGEGSWALPVGHLEYGEKLVDTAKRELKEELDIDTPILTLCTVTDNPLMDGHNIHVSFNLENFDGKFSLMEPDKCEEWRFYEINQLPENLFLYHQRILETFKAKKLYLY